MRSHVAPEINIKLVRFENERHDDDEKSQRNQFENRCDNVDEAGLTHAAQDDEVKEPDQQ